LIALLKALPSLSGVVYDAPRTLEGTRQRIAKHGLEARCELTPGSFFLSVPAGGDAYMLRNVLHDWDDDHVLTILRNCRAAMEPDAVLLISEVILPEGPATQAIRYCDLQVMVTLGGCQRTGNEFRRLLDLAGFELTRIVPTGWLSMAEARPKR
jgi:hypothetical protein